MLGSEAEAEDAVQEAWFRLDRAGADGIANLDGWLTTVVGRICLDMLWSRNSRREEPLPEVAVAGDDPERDAVLADDVGRAMLVVLDTLGPAERVAHVLHDMFDVPFGEIGTVLERSPDSAKMLASRARRRIAAAPGADPDAGRQHAVVSAFFAASREGDFGALLALLDPEVVLRADAAGIALGTPEAAGAHDVASFFSGRAKAARLALVAGMPGAAWAPGGKPRVVFRFTLASGRITVIDQIADPGTVAGLDVVLA
jgi:RNA polymerase sigma-70 factor (ECF subfamily)